MGKTYENIFCPECTNTENCATGCINQSKVQAIENLDQTPTVLGFQFSSKDAIIKLVEELYKDVLDLESMQKIDKLPFFQKIEVLLEKVNDGLFMSSRSIFHVYNENLVSSKLRIQYIKDHNKKVKYLWKVSETYVKNQTNDNKITFVTAINEVLEHIKNFSSYELNNIKELTPIENIIIEIETLMKNEIGTTPTVKNFKDTTTGLYNINIKCHPQVIKLVIKDLYKNYFQYGKEGSFFAEVNDEKLVITFSNTKENIEKGMSYIKELNHNYSKTTTNDVHSTRSTQPVSASLLIDEFLVNFMEAKYTKENKDNKYITTIEIPCIANKR